MDDATPLMGRIELGAVDLRAYGAAPFEPTSSQSVPGFISEDRVRQIVREELVEAVKRLMPPVV